MKATTAPKFKAVNLGTIIRHNHCTGYKIITYGGKINQLFIRFNGTGILIEFRPHNYKLYF